MSKPIKSSSDAIAARGAKTESVDDMMIRDVQFDTSHSINDEFGYPQWAHPLDSGNRGNPGGLKDGSVQPVDSSPYQDSDNATTAGDDNSEEPGRPQDDD